MGWLISAGILFLIAIFPLGVFLSYDESGFLIQARVSFLHIGIYPQKKKTNNKEKTSQENKKEKPEKARAKSGQKQEEKKKGGSFKDFLPLVSVGMDFLGDFRRKLRVNRLFLKIILAGDDPCDLAVNYGRAWAALANIQVMLERAFVIKKRDLEAECDFEGEAVTITAALDISITLGRLLALVSVYGVKGLVIFLKIRKIRKERESHESKAA